MTFCSERVGAKIVRNFAEIRKNGHCHPGSVKLPLFGSMRSLFVAKIMGAGICTYGCKNIKK